MSVALNGDIPKGGRGVSGLRAHLTALAQADPDAIRKEVIAQGRIPFCDGLVDTLKETTRYCHSCHRHGKERWAFLLYAQLAGLVGAAPSIALTIVNSVGAPVDFARGAVNIVRDAEGMDAHATARLAMQTALAYCSREGITLAQLAERASGAEVIETNGNGGPHG